MPSFVCNRCQETLKKPKLDSHVQRCRGASFSCIDCYRNFLGTDYREHFSCITEVEKYEKKKPITVQQASSTLVDDASRKRPATLVTTPLTTPETSPTKVVVKVADSSKELSPEATLLLTLKSCEGPVTIKALERLLKDKDIPRKTAKKFLRQNVTLSLSKEGKVVATYVN